MGRIDWILPSGRVLQANEGGLTLRSQRYRDFRPSTKNGRPADMDAIVAKTSEGLSML